jgi:hypothetical protein
MDKGQKSFYQFFSLAFAIRPLPRPFLRLRLETNDHSAFFSLYYGLQHVVFPFPSRCLRRFSARGVPKNEKTEIGELVGKNFVPVHFCYEID